MLVRRKGRLIVAACSVTVCFAAAIVMFGQQSGQPQGQPPDPAKKGQGRKGGGFGPQLGPLEETGFTSIFDGSTMKGWEGDPEFWKVENGALVGWCTAEKQPAQNTFLIYRGGTFADFELKLDYKLTGNNSGIQIRSIELPDVKLAMKGYQADMDAQQRFTGQFYEERGRGFLAMRGQFNYIAPDAKKGIVSSLGSDEELKAIIKSDDWNSVHLIARGNTLIQMINGRVTSMLIDDDAAGRKMDGLIGFQVHRGPAMRVEFKNVRVKKF